MPRVFERVFPQPDHTARFTRDFTPTNSSGFGSNWCGQAFIIAGKVDLTATANLK